MDGKQLTVRCSCRPWLLLVAVLPDTIVVDFALALAAGGRAVFVCCPILVVSSDVIPPGVFLFAELQLPGFPLDTRSLASIRNSKHSPDSRTSSPRPLIYMYFLKASPGPASDRARSREELRS